MSRVVPLPASNTVVDSTVAIVNADGTVASFTAASPAVVVGNVADDAADSGAPVKVGGRYQLTPVTRSDGDRVDMLMSRIGQVKTDNIYAQVMTDAFSNTGAYFTDDTGFPRMVGVGNYKFNGTTWDRDRKPTAASRIVSAAASTNATSAKASAGDLHRVMGYNAALTVRYLKFYNKASAPTVGTDVPVLTIALAPSSAFERSLDSFYFSTGIAYAMTTGSADADTGALTAGDVLGLNVVYA